MAEPEPHSRSSAANRDRFAGTQAAGPDRRGAAPLGAAPRRFHDEGHDYVRWLERTGVPVNLLVEPTYHAAELEVHTTVPAIHASNRR